MNVFNPHLPLADASTLPTSYYLDEAIFEKEKQIFENTWQHVGCLDMLPEPNSYFLSQIIDEPIIVVRKKEGELSIITSLSNVCRHKGTVLINNHLQNPTTKFRCPYHGWTYDTGGKLIGCPEFDGVNNFCKEENSLKEFETACYNQFIFVKLEGKNDFQEYTKHLPKTNHLKHYSRIGYDVNCNWKIFIDNYLDGGYHVNYAHKSLAQVVDYSKYKTKIFDKVVLQTSPLETNDSDASATRKGNAYYGWMWPNFMINIYDDLMDTNVVIPTGVNSCKVIFDFYFSDNFEFPEKSIELADQIQREDIMICERVQKGIKSKYYDSGRLSVKREAGIYKFHQMLYECYDGN